MFRVGSDPDIAHCRGAGLRVEKDTSGRGDEKEKQENGPASCAAGKGKGLVLRMGAPILKVTNFASHSISAG